MRKPKFRFPFKPVIISAIIFLALGLIAGYIWDILRNSEYFRIKDVVTKDSQFVDLSYLVGRNIFSVDLKRESGYILDSYPNYQKIRLIRVLPNRIFVDLIERSPVALVKLYKYFALDNEGTLFYPEGELQGLDLPVIVGLETRIFGAKPGKKYNLKEVMLALSIIREVKANRILKNCKIRKIDVSSAANASLFIPFKVKAPANFANQPPQDFESLLEVKLGEDNIRDKIILLGGLLLQTKNDLANMRYIDLRFKEPVIKMKEEKGKK